MPDRILVVDDMENIIQGVQLILEGQEDREYEVLGAGTAEAGMALLNQQAIDLLILDVELPEMQGMDALPLIRRDHPDLPVVVISGNDTVNRAVEAIQKGAQDFLAKPFSRDRLIVTVGNVLEYRRMRQENKRLRGDPLDRIVGESAAAVKLREEIRRIGTTEARVLIRGESGTGKELVARALHALSPRSRKPFIKLNCAAIPHDLIEAELFGAVKGAYTGATAARDGRFAAADKGTLFLDEIGDMSLAAQTKVLRVLQEGEFEPVGSTQTRTVDVRVLAATHKDLRQGVAEGWFREDLYYRLEVVPVTVPPLRERPGDVDLLLRSFLQHFADQHGVTPPTLHAAAGKLLEAHAWPGNVRELMNVAERLVILRHGLEVTRDDLPDTVLDPSAGPAAAIGGAREAAGGLPYAHLPLREAKAALERDLIADALSRHQGNVTRAARDLGLERTNLHKRIRALGLRDDQEGLRDGQEDGS